MFPIQLPPQLCCLWRSSSQFGSKTSRNWMVATTFTSSSSWHYEGFWCGFSPDLPNRVAAPIWPLSGFHPPANWRWQPRVLNKKTKRFTKGMVLKYHQEILYPTKQANWRAAESSPLAGVLKRPLHLHQSSK